MKPTSTCAKCKRFIVFGVFVEGEWSHEYGGRYCLDRNGFTATPLSVATPVVHGPEDVL